MSIKITDSNGEVSELHFVFMSHQPEFRDCQWKLIVWQDGDFDVYGLDFDIMDGYLHDVVTFISEKVTPVVTSWELCHVMQRS